MSKYLKMSEVFRIEVAPDDFHISPFCVNEECDDGVTAHEYAAHAVSSHDELVQLNQELLAALEGAKGLLEHYGRTYGHVIADYTEYMTAAEVLNKAKGK